MVETARALNPGIEVVVRSHNAHEAVLLERDGAGTVFVGESELAKAMAAFVLGRVQANWAGAALTLRAARDGEAGKGPSGALHADAARTAHAGEPQGRARRHAAP